MRERFEELKDRWSEFMNDPENRNKRIALFSGLGVVAVLLVALLAINLNSMTKRAQAVEAGGLIEGQSASTERNAAGGVIADIDWDTVIGYDKDGNPIYGTYGMVPTVGGYDMCGAPIYKEDMVVTGMAEDGLPIYGNYSAIEQARIRGQKNGDPDIDWNTIVAYDADGNPIFGSKGGDPNIIGYDMLGNPIYKGSVTVIGRTDSGLPIYNYSTIKTAKVAGKEAQNSLSKNSGQSGVDALAKALAAQSKSGLTADQIKALIESYLEDGVISDDEIADLANKTGLTESQIRALLEKYGVGQKGSGNIGGTASIQPNSALSLANDNSNASSTKKTVDDPTAMEKLIKELARLSGMSEDEVRSILSKYMSDGKLTEDELSKLARDLGLSEDQVKSLINDYGVGKTSTTSGSNGSNGTSGSNGTNGTNGTSGRGTNGTNGTNGVNGGRGISGSSGTNGTNGTGTSGTNGTNGTNGTGTSGTNGTNGTNGTGTAGARGADGTNGKDGKDGKDANTNMHTVTFNSNGGSAVGNQKVVDGGTAVRPGNPTRAGYKFNGWYKGSSIYNFSNTVTSDFTLTANWTEETYSIDYENISGADNTPTMYSYTAATESFTLPQPTLPGYTFAGWTGTGLTGLTKEVTVSKGSSGDRKYKANWTVKKPVISFDWNFEPEMETKRDQAEAEGKLFTLPQTASIQATYGKTYAEAVVISDDLSAWPEISSNKEVYGYYFTGWYIKGENGDRPEDGQIVKEYSTVAVTEDTTLYAGWEKSPYADYKVVKWLQKVDSAKTYGVNAAHDRQNFTSMNAIPYSEKEDAAVTAPVDVVSGFDSPEEMTMRIKADGSTVFNYYYTRKQYNLEVRKGDHVDTANGPAVMPYFEEPVEVTATASTGYKITSWSSVPTDLPEKRVEGNKITFTMPAGDTMVQANAEPIRYTIVYHKNDGGTTDDTYTSTALYDARSGDPATAGYLLSENTFVRDGYHFVGWSKTANATVGQADFGTGNVNQANDINDRLTSASGDSWYNTPALGAVPHGNLTTSESNPVNLYAVWAKNAYTVTVANGSDHDSEASLVNGRSIDAVASVKLAGDGVNLRKRYEIGETVEIEATPSGTVSANGRFYEEDSKWQYCGTDGEFDTSDDVYEATDITTAGEHRRKKTREYTFDKWEIVGGNIGDSTEKTYSFTMPASSVTATAKGSCSVTKTLSHVYQGAGRAEYIGGASISASGGTRTVNVKLPDGYKWEYCSVYAWSGQDTGALERSSVVVYFKDGSTKTIFGYAPRNKSQDASFSRYFSEAQMANIDFVQCTAYLGGGVNSSSTAYAYCYGSKLPWAAE